MKTGLFGGDWEDYIQPVNDHFDNLAASIQSQGAQAELARMGAFDGVDPAMSAADDNAAGETEFWQDNLAPDAEFGATSVPMQPGNIAQKALANWQMANSMAVPGSSDGLRDKASGYRPSQGDGSAVWCRTRQWASIAMLWFSR